MCLVVWLYDLIKYRFHLRTKRIPRFLKEAVIRKSFEALHGIWWVPE